MLCVITTIRLLLSVDGPNKDQKLTQVHNMDGTNKGSRVQSTKWTDPTRVKLTQVHNVDGPNKGSRLQSTKWTDPKRVKHTQVHNVDGPNEGSRL